MARAIALREAHCQCCRSSDLFVDDPVGAEAHPAPPDLTIAADRSIVRSESPRTEITKKNRRRRSAAAAPARRRQRVALLAELARGVGSPRTPAYATAVKPALAGSRIAR